MNFTYNLVSFQLKLGHTKGLAEKLDLFLLNNRLTADEYQELSTLLKEKEGSK